MNFELQQRDAIKALSTGDRECANLIYADPPFYSGQDWEMPDGRLAFSDKWPSFGAYVEWLRALCKGMARSLAPGGCVYLHIDPTVSHYARMALDEAFGAENFMREIVWRIGWVSGYKSAAKNWVRNHDVILYYVKDRANFTFHKEYVPYPTDYKRRDGKPGQGQGFPIEDVWNGSKYDTLDSIQIKSLSTEKTGYPTQKPVALLERIVAASSNVGDVVLDPVCGSGTTAVAALRLGRQPILVDSSPVAIQTVRQRFSLVSQVVGG